MIKVPFIQSRNFNSHEIARSATSVDAVGLYLTGYAHGVAQMLRDACFKKYGNRFKGLTVTSSNRAAYNGNVKNAAANSHHIWRVEADGSLHVAMDFRPIGITLTELYDTARSLFRGEIYLNNAEGIVHVAIVPMEDEHWIQ